MKGFPKTLKKRKFKWEYLLLKRSKRLTKQGRQQETKLLYEKRSFWLYYCLKIHGFRKNNIRKYIILIKSIRVNFKADQSTSNPTNCRVHENMFSTTTDAYLKP